MKTNTITKCRADQVEALNTVTMVNARGMSFVPGFGHGLVTKVHEGGFGYRVFFFGPNLVTVPDDAECWVSEPEVVPA